MVEMHLLAVNVDFRYDPIYALGVVTSFDRFMQGYRPEGDKDSIFTSLCQAVQDDPNRYKADAGRLQTVAQQLSVQDLVAWLQQQYSVGDAQDLQDAVRAIAHNPKFKYSRLFAIGLFTLLEYADAEMIKDEAKRNDALKQACAALNLPDSKVQKDLDLYRNNLEKLAQAQAVLEDILKADQKKRAQQAETSIES